jgi:hypothetical protein
VIKQIKLAIDYFTSRLPSLANIGLLFGISRASKTRLVIFSTTADKRTAIEGVISGQAFEQTNLFCLGFLLRQHWTTDPFW